MLAAAEPMLCSLEDCGCSDVLLMHYRGVRQCTSSVPKESPASQWRGAGAGAHTWSSTQARCDSCFCIALLAFYLAVHSHKRIVKCRAPEQSLSSICQPSFFQAAVAEPRGDCCGARASCTCGT